MYPVNRPRMYLVLFAALFLQCTLAGYVAVGGVRPDLVILSVIFFGLFLGRSAGLEAGAVAGLMTDLFSLDYFGINMVVYGITGLLAGSLRSSFARESKRSQVLLVFVCTAFAMCVHFAVASAFSRSISLGFLEYLKACVLPAGIYTALVSIPIFMKFMKMYSLKEQDDLL